MATKQTVTVARPPDHNHDTQEVRLDVHSWLEAFAMMRQLWNAGEIQQARVACSRELMRRRLPRTFDLSPRLIDYEERRYSQSQITPRAFILRVHSVPDTADEMNQTAKRCLTIVVCERERNVSHMTQLLMEA